MNNPPIRFTTDEQSLFRAAQLPWFIRAWLWTLHPVATTRGRIVVGVLAGCIIGSAATAFVHTLALVLP